MKINQYGTQSVNPYHKSFDKQATPSQTNAQQEDKVEISAKAKELQKGPDLMMERQEKIARLKAAVENGTYQIDRAGIAEKMVNFYKQQ
ncbi:flagellar biosynthesis anti-sigma factor FlgM [Bacillus glycinifermentans]|uniref:Negative regulator of flagellin synthesis n=1 Tax=Bacillus glycinifermentans TaxID=1664069 RepID=A0A0J6HX00_9BACI|nr:flagellar biosynthesis anti-sigma factor FlgM [Bacillus glycinifermentans]ATH93438.1 flagellar biosynthesis anti-sigma factor FlgM [Bacillus glycinifermentans]KMM63502.1 flagellar biosynthesis anti-sigma factor FlgM [Bacillus glycinifermentans]KRT90396.1 flagellar biosynthesis anti-sigma factor FlgM [Bacillus glycinifermentans]MEC0484099.1 flagellar biosynthesis anti-sigma factor FlgM [Bacillus glycinifermentans]MEC0494213.1 flagellar biosynthesis anti-sigma factor FlgM [Bacillus glycinifer